MKKYLILIIALFSIVFLSSCTEEMLEKKRNQLLKEFNSLVEGIDRTTINKYYLELIDKSNDAGIKLLNAESKYNNLVRDHNNNCGKIERYIQKGTLVGLNGIADDFQGDGAKESPYLIGSIETLRLFVFNQLIDEVINPIKGYYQLTCDIDFNETPLYINLYGSSLVFSGVFDGNGHSFYNVNSKYTSGYGYRNNLFYTNNGTIMNLNIINSLAHAELEIETVLKPLIHGVLTNMNYGTISNCYCEVLYDATIRYKEDKVYPNNLFLGGLAGFNRGSIENCIENLSGTVILTDGSSINVREEVYPFQYSFLTIGCPSYKNSLYRGNIVFLEKDYKGELVQNINCNCPNIIERNSHNINTYSYMPNYLINLVKTAEESSLSSKEFFTQTLQFDENIWSFENLLYNDDRYQEGAKPLVKIK